MSAALDEPRARSPGAHPPVGSPAGSTGRLLAVRKAGAPFGGPLNLRSGRFELLAEEWARASARLAGLRERLVEELFRAVPEALDRGRRRRLLQLKRDVHNERPLPALPRALPRGLRGDLESYSELLRRRERALADARREVFAETRRRIREALENPRLRLACRYSSPDLWRAIGEPDPGTDEGFSPAERGIYAYAAKLVAKANPFHLFSEVLFPPETGIEPGGEVEVVFDTELAFDLERRLLPAAGDPERVWMHLRPVRPDGGSHRFWVASSGGSRVVSLRASEPLRSVLSFFESRRRASGRPTGTRADWQAHLRHSHSSAERQPVHRLLRGLVDRGIVVEYLVTDFRDFPAQLRGLSDRFDPLLDVLRDWHLAPKTVRDLEGLDGELAAVENGPDGPRELRYFVNAYGRSGSGRHRAAAEAVSAHLADLKPLFSVEHNFSESDHVIHSFLRDFLERRPGASAPYLEALRHFLRHRDEIIRRYRPEVYRPRGDRRRLEAWRARAAAERGSLARERVLELSARARRLAEPRDLCFNGTFDHARGRFYVSNVFAGRGRFASRYVLRRPGETSPADPPSPEAVDAELSVPPRPSLNFVVGAYPVGCGFDARFSHRYRRWIDAAEVVVTLRDGDVVYLEEGSGRRLRFHYRGFLLAQLLPAEYQLLLAGHADAFTNPFLRDDGETTPGPDAGTRHVPALFYGPVCLRRERWEVALEEVRALVRGDDVLRASLLLRDRIRQRMKGVDAWYYRLPGGTGERPRPRFLDLRSPLSVHAFRRALKAAPEGGRVSLSPMEPPPEHLFEDGGSRFVTELMVEV